MGKKTRKSRLMPYMLVSVVASPCEIPKSLKVKGELITVHSLKLNRVFQISAQKAVFDADFLKKRQKSPRDSARLPSGVMCQKHRVLRLFLGVFRVFGG